LGGRLFSSGGAAGRYSHRRASNFYRNRQSRFSCADRRASHAGFAHFAKRSYANTKSHQKKAPLLSATLRCATGDLRWEVSAGVLLELAALKQSQALIPPPPPIAGAATRGKSGTGHCFARRTANIRDAQRAVTVLGFAERSDGSPRPSGCAEERRAQRIRACDCLSAASSSKTPLSPSTAGCPERSAGTQAVGSPSLWLLSLGEARESDSPAGARPGLHPSRREQKC